MKNTYSGIFYWLKITGLIIGPLIIALIVGKFLDTKFDTQPWIFLLTTGLAFMISIVSIVHVAKRYIKTLDTSNDGSNTPN